MTAPPLLEATPQTPFYPVVDNHVRPIFPNDVGAGKPAYWIMVSVISMGGNTQVLIGNSVSQTDGLYSKTDFMIYDVPPGSYFDASKYFIVSDVDNSAVIAVSGMYVPPGVKLAPAQT